MKRYKILHLTEYAFSGFVQLRPHTLRLRPREGHELRIESSVLDIAPVPLLRWYRDVEGNSVATATFSDNAQSLSVKSEITIQQYDHAPHDFLVADHAVNYPFSYEAEERVLLSPYLNHPDGTDTSQLSTWLQQVWQPAEKIQTFALLLRLNQMIYQQLRYQKREEEGVQSPAQTLEMGSGSCRDSACLFMAAARQLGLAARFVSGYLYSAATADPAGEPGSTHAWAEVFIPGAGWKGFDPSNGKIVGAEHIAVSVARLPESVPPIAGAFHGLPGANMTVRVWVTALN